jgi:hypothetical protein
MLITAESDSSSDPTDSTTLACVSYPEESIPQRWHDNERAFDPTSQLHPDQRYIRDGGYRPPEPGQAEVRPEEFRPQSPAWTSDRPAEGDRSGEQPLAWEGPRQQLASPVGSGSRYQVERVPLLNAQARYSEQSASDGFPTAPMTERPHDPPTSQMPMVSSGTVPVATPLHSTQQGQPSYSKGQVSQRRSVPEPVGDGDGVYRSRRPVVAVALALVAVLLGIPAFLLLGEAATADRISASGVVVGSLLVLGLPSFVAGMYGLITGAGWAVERHGARVLLRPPLSYLVIGITLLLGAALAVR